MKNASFRKMKVFFKNAPKLRNNNGFVQSWKTWKSASKYKKKRFFQKSASATVLTVRVNL